MDYFSHICRHSDHVVGFPDLWLTGWLISPRARCATSGVGAAGTSRMMSHLKQAYEYDILIRLQNDGAARKGIESALRISMRESFMTKVG